MSLFRRHGTGQYLEWQAGARTRSCREARRLSMSPKSSARASRAARRRAFVYKHLGSLPTIGGKAAVVDSRRDQVQRNARLVVLGTRPRRFPLAPGTESP